MASTGGSAITKWQYAQKSKPSGGSYGSWGGWQDVSGTSTAMPSTTVSSLTNGTEYKFKVRAVNGTDSGAASPESDAATPSTKPPAPSKPSVAAGDKSVTLSGASVASTGGSAITKWQYAQKSKPSGGSYGSWGGWQDVSGTSTAMPSTTVSSLTNGTEYKFKVRAVNARGDGAESPESDAATPLRQTGGSNPPPPSTTPPATLTASAVKETTATLSIEGHTGNWWYKRDGSGAECTGVDADTATANLSGLIGGASYVYKAYGNKDCTTELTADDTDAEFSTVGLTAGSITANGATLRIANWTASWWYEGNQQGAQCTSVGANTANAALSDLTADAEYTYRAYSATGCDPAAEIADVDFRTLATVLDGARDTVRKVLNRTLAAVGTRTLTSALGNIGTRLADDAPGTGLTLAGQQVPMHADIALTGSADGSCTDGGTGRHSFSQAGARPVEPECGTEINRAVESDELFRTSAFNMLLGTEPGKAGEVSAGPLWALWGRGDFGNFDGRPEPGTSYSGEMRTGWLGFDGRAGPWVAGIAVSHGKSETEYDFDSGGGIDGRGRLETELTAVYPYGRWTLPDGLELQGVVGVGSGKARHQPEEGMDETSPLSMRMVSTGVRHALPAPGEVDLALRADASLVRMEMGDGPKLVSGVSANSWRLRAGLEASRHFELKDGVALELFAEAAGRRDGGTGVTGTGLEVAGGMRYTAPRLQIEARGRWLAVHSEKGARERGVSVTARVGPGARGRGLSLSLNPRWGADTGRAEALWQDGMPHRAGDEDGGVDAGALDARIGYGFTPEPGSLLTPFAEMGLSEGDSQRIRLGTRFEARRGALALELSAEHRESGGAPPENGARLDVRLRF